MRESDVFTPGNLGPCWVTTPWCVVGVGICRDLRFPEHALLLSSSPQGADATRMIVYPAAFNEVREGMGRKGWVLLRARKP